MMSHRITAFTLSSIVVLAMMPGDGQTTHEQCPHKTKGVEAPAAMMERGEHAMGFSQTSTTHHFSLRADGGVIAVSANDGKDAEAREQIRMHLRHIARAFSHGDFEIPMFVHDQTPPGVPAMKQHARDIQYDVKETEAGGQVTLSSHDREAIDAIHDFLKFQIREHKTGDPETVVQPAR
jgi:hypothetical protein